MTTELTCSYTTGWEHGLLYFNTTSNNSPDSAGCSCTVHTRLSIQGSVVRSGSYALKIAHSGQANFWSYGGKIVPNKQLRVYHRVSAVPTVDVVVAQLGFTAGSERRYGIGIRGSTGKYALWVKVAGGAGLVWGSDGPSVVVDTWARLEFRGIKVSGTPDTHTTDGYVDGVALGNAVDTTSTATSSLESIILGNTTPITSFSVTYDEYFDDLVCHGLSSLGTPPWPIGAGVVEILVPNGEGTHSNAAHFTDSNGNSPPTNPHLLLDEIPNSTGSTDYVYQTTAGATSYLELTMTNLVATSGRINGINAADGFSVQLDGPDFVDLSDHVTQVWDTDEGAGTNVMTSQGSIGGGDGGQSGVPGTRIATSNGPFTVSVVNNMTMRIGKRGDLVEQSRWHALWIEVDVEQGAATAEGWGILLA